MPGTPQDSESLVEQIRMHVDRLCSPGDRDLGTSRNRAATDYVASAMREAGFEVEELPFAVPEWQYGEATIRMADREYAMHPGPFSASIEAGGPLIMATRASELDGLRAEGCVLLLHGEIAHVQFTPRGYPFYQDAEHAAVLEALEATGAATIVAATDKNPSMTGGMSPFPLIEEPEFSIPTAYMHAEEGAELASHSGERVAVSIDSRTLPSTGVQPVGIRRASGDKRVVIGAHVDSKPGTPGAIDNAAGVAVMLAAAELLKGSDLATSVELVPFNGEDHVLAPGELAYLQRHDVSQVELMINIDAAGLPGLPSAYSHYNAGPALIEMLGRIAESDPSIVLGEEWPASDHMIFAMQGIPSVAITSQDFATASGVYSHTPLDAPDVLDYALLADTARFVAEVTRAVAGGVR